MPRSPDQELANAQAKLDAARKRLADSRRRRRDLATEGHSLGDAISAELYTAGREHREADIGDKRERIAEIERDLADLDRLDTGVEASVADAANEVAAVRFRHAPHFEAALVAQAERLAAERTQLEPALAAVAEREEDIRSAWRTIAAAIPGQTTDIYFEGDATIPHRRPSEPHPAISNYVASEDWPSWFHDCVRTAERLYAARQPEETPA
ncbi:MAG TPA: hypothetical protein VLB81_02000 [Gaiellales bacterium]|nr:hypothetical protein [Gaiellales bacterium]